MRLWHIDLIPYLPRTQLLAQWRELNSIFKNKPNHILINYVYDYEQRNCLANYTYNIVGEFINRKYDIKSFKNVVDYFSLCVDNETIIDLHYKLLQYIRMNESNNSTFQQTLLQCHRRKLPTIFKEHDFSYLEICYFNLKEKALRGQKDFNAETFLKMQDCYLQQKSLQKEL